MALCKGGKLRSIGNSKGEMIGYMFWCPGCDGAHSVYTQNEPVVWAFNGDVEKPTFTPSLMLYGTAGSPQCHSHVRDGQIQFIADCTHKLAGQTVDIPAWPEDHMAFEDNHGG